MNIYPVCLNSVELSFFPSDAQKLSKIVTDLGLVTKLKWRIAENKTKTEMETERLNNQMEGKGKIFHPISYVYDNLY